MRLYSDFADHRARQITADVIALTLIALWIWLGVTVFTLIESLADFGVQMEQAGAGFRETMTEVGENLGGVPVIGGGIRVPFDGASQAGGALEAAGQSQQDAVLQLAVVLGVGIAALPILMILALWLIPRVRFVRKSSRARQLVASGAGIDLLALRALANQKLATLARVDPDAMAAWRRGDDRVLRELASLELKSSGVRLQP
jgi:Na+(H+)/acetate symporter ActP